MLKRRLLLVAVVILGALAQNCVLPVAGIQICFLLPLTVIIAMFEKELPGTLYGLLAGCMWDVSTTTADGMKAMILAILGCGCGLLIRYVVRNTLLSAIVLCSIATLLFNVVHWIFYVVLIDTEGMFAALLRFYLPQMVLTLLFTPLFYFLLRALEKRYRVTEEDREAIR